MVVDFLQTHMEVAVKAMVGLPQLVQALAKEMVLRAVVALPLHVQALLVKEVMLSAVVN